MIPTVPAVETTFTFEPSSGATPADDAAWVALVANPADRVLRASSDNPISKAASASDIAFTDGPNGSKDIDWWRGLRITAVGAKPRTGPYYMGHRGSESVLTFALELDRIRKAKSYRSYI